MIERIRISDCDEHTFKVLTAKACPYCGSDTVYVDSSVVYGKSYGMIYLCKPCDAWCGVHKGTADPLGRLANAELRDKKKKAHAAFDPLWTRKMNQGVSKTVARKLAYAWLASQMELDIKFCHIGLFDEGQCEKVIELCAPYN